MKRQIVLMGGGTIAGCEVLGPQYSNTRLTDRRFAANIPMVLNPGVFLEK